jgi:DNA-binding Lrp family transcriptional regulator
VLTFLELDWRSQQIYRLKREYTTPRVDLDRGWLVTVDAIDKRLLLELDTNCRMSYQNLAKRVGLSVSAVRKRMSKLQEQGVIKEFRVYLTLAHTGADILLAILYMNGYPTDDTYLDIVGSYTGVWALIPLSTGNIAVFAEYSGAVELAEIGRFLRGLQGVQRVEMHTLLYDKGSSCEFTSFDRKVLGCLAQDARMSISDIAENTGMTPRRVRKILTKFLGEGEGGSTPEYFTMRSTSGDKRTSQACLHFRVIWDLNAAGRIGFMIRIDWHEEKFTANEIVNWLEKEFPVDFWYALTSASEPTLFCVFAIEHLRDSEPIINKIAQEAFTKSVLPMLGYPTKWYISPRQDLLRELIEGD